MEDNGTTAIGAEKAATVDVQTSRRPGILRRPLAMLIDALILGCGGLILGIALFDTLAHMGAWGRLIGFLIALVYFGVLNSHLGHGQTLGKRILRIEVVQLTGLPLSVSSSFLRSAILSLPYFANGLPLPLSRTPKAVFTLLSVVVFGIGGAILYLYLFNRASRRSLHDLLARSVVVRSRPGFIPSAPLWRGHIAIIAAVGLGLITLTLIAVQLVSTRADIAQMLKVVEAVEGSQKVHTAGVWSGKTWGPKGSGTFLKVTALLKRRPASFEQASDEIAAIVLKTSPDVMNMNQLWVAVGYGYDIGIAHWSIGSNTNLPPMEWTKRLARRLTRAAAFSSGVGRRLV